MTYDVGSQQPGDDELAKLTTHEPSNEKVATITTARRKSPRELGWRHLNPKSLYVGDDDKQISGIHFRHKTLASKETRSFPSDQLECVERLQHRSHDANRGALTELLASYHCRKKGRRLRLRYGCVSSAVDTGGLFTCPSTTASTTSDSMLAYVAFSRMARRRAHHLKSLPKRLAGREHGRITPREQETDAQIALVMAAMAQEMLRGRGAGQQDRRGTLVKVVGIGDGRMHLYRSRVPRRFVKRFVARTGLTVEYTSVSLQDGHQVLEQLDCFLNAVH